MFKIQNGQNIKESISRPMAEAIERWENLYMDKVMKDVDGNILKSLNIPFAIANEKARTACLEMKTEIKSKENSERTTFLNDNYQDILMEIRSKLTHGLALGTMILKPMYNPSTKSISCDFVMANQFQPISYNNKKLTHVFFFDTLHKENARYIRTEEHELVDGVIKITNKAYKSSINNFDLGQEINLNAVQEWADLEKYTEIKNSNNEPFTSLLFAVFKNPDANNIDLTSQLGVSCFSAVESLIKEAYNVYTSLLWELEGGELAIHASPMALKTFGDDHTKLPQKSERLFRAVTVSTSSGLGELYDVFNPVLRDSSYINVLTTILAQIEDKCGLSRGTLCQSENVAHTATEIKMLKQRTYQTNHDIQKALERTLKELIKVMDIYTSLYCDFPQDEINVTFEWDDSIITDIDSELQQRLSLVTMGGMTAEEVTAWYLNVTVEQRYQDMQEQSNLKKQYNGVPLLYEKESEW